MADHTVKACVEKHFRAPLNDPHTPKNRILNYPTYDLKSQLWICVNKQPNLTFIAEINEVLICDRGPQFSITEID